jgi:hypothetical protein
MQNIYQHQVIYVKFKSVDFWKSNNIVKDGVN